MKTQGECQKLSGEYVGGTTCPAGKRERRELDVNGACVFPTTGNTCVDVQGGSEFCGSVYKGDGTSCKDQGACHIDDSGSNGRWQNCQLMTRQRCLLTKVGTFELDGNCKTNKRELDNVGDVPLGACTQDSNLTCWDNHSMDMCSALNGKWQGEGTTCEELGACHVKATNNGRWHTCKMESRALCLVDHGDFESGGQC